jgi:polysaccharide export outer membrane protein
VIFSEVIFMMYTQIPQRRPWPRSIRLVSLVFVAGLCAQVALAQQQGVASRIRNTPPATNTAAQGGQVSAEGGALNDNLLTETRKDYRISSGDVVEVWVEDAPELSRNYRVNAAGEFPMSIVGRVAVSEKTAEEVGHLIAARLEAEEYLNKPNVVVTVRQYNSQTFMIQGSVNKPGIYQLEGRPDMFTLIGLAGGLSETHGSTAFILRSKARSTESPNAPAPDSQPAGGAVKSEAVKSEAVKLEANQADAAAGEPGPAGAGAAEDAKTGTERDYELIRVNLGALYKGHFEQNQTLEPRDIVNIPRADVFFVAGEVAAPGSYPLKDGTTLRQAISLAQGMTFKAKKGQGMIYREDPDTGKRQEMKVDIGAIMSGKQDDIAISANDVIIVPNSRTKSISSALLTAFGTNAARLPVRY